ncbi:MAG: hypothetical protein ACREH8_02470 [Opitutaceae bacterium]
MEAVAVTIAGEPLAWSIRGQPGFRGMRPVLSLIALLFSFARRQKARVQSLALRLRTVLTSTEMTNAASIWVVEDEDDLVLLLESAFRKAQFSNPVHRRTYWLRLNVPANEPK